MSATSNVSEDVGTGNLLPRDSVDTTAATSEVSSTGELMRSRATDMGAVSATGHRR